MSTLNVIIMSAITILGTFIQVKFQTKNWTPFETHYWLMSGSFIVLFTYVVSAAANTMQLEAQQSNDNNGEIMSKIILLSGSLASVLLLVVILPVLGWFALFFWALYFLKIVYDLVKYAFVEFLYKLIEAIHGQLKPYEENHELPV